MADQEHGRSSSSPSVSIASLSRRKNGRPGEEISVTLSDASSFFVSLRVWEDKPFHEGDEIDADAWELILRESTSIRAYSIALSLLARSEHSRFLLKQKLQLRDIPNDLINPVLDSLEDGGQLSDRRYALSWVRSRLHSHPEGMAHLVGGLRSRGIGEQLARAAVDETLEEQGQTMEDIARSVVDRLTRRKSLSSRQLVERLYRRGFSRETISRVIESGFSYD